MKIIKATLLTLIISFSLLVSSQDLSDQIPDLGQPENRYFSANLQNLYGRLVYSEFYNSPIFVHEPIVAEYINNLGHQLFSNVTDSRHIPRFFVIKQNTINAFAYPGGTIGFHTGLITKTQTESELAGVMAHELSHVSQNHIARSVQNSAKQAPLQLLATLVTVLAASSGSNNSDAVIGSLAVTQGLFAQQSINFTRSQETEADQVGIKLMEKSKFNVTGFRDFFSRLQRNYSDDRAVKIPELLRSHPLPRSRIAETNSRLTTENTKEVPNSFSYEIARAILFEQLPEENRPDINSINYSEHGKRFHQALRTYSKDHDAGISSMLSLSNESFDANVHLKLAEMQLNARRRTDSIKTVELALKLFPKNTLLSLFKAERLLESKNSATVITLLENLEHSANPRITQLLAKAHEQSNNLPEAYYQLANHYYAIGNYYQALYQLDNALANKNLSAEQRARIKQKYERIYHELPDDLRDEIIKANRRPNNR